MAVLFKKDAVLHPHLLCFASRDSIVIKINDRVCPRGVTLCKRNI